MSNSYICRVCGASFPEDELTLMDDELLCETCLDEETLVCLDCGTRIWSEQNAGSSEHPLCQRCFDRNYTTCERCGAVLSFDSVFIWTTMMICPIAKAAVRCSETTPFTITVIVPNPFSMETHPGISVWSLKLTVRARSAAMPRKSSPSAIGTRSASTASMTAVWTTALRSSATRQH